MMKVIDNRKDGNFVRFGDLAIGEAFADDDGDVHIKTDIGATMYWDADEKIWKPYNSAREDDSVAPVNISYVIGTT